MLAPTLTSFAAPRGGAVGLGQPGANSRLRKQKKDCYL